MILECPAVLCLYLPSYVSIFYAWGRIFEYTPYFGNKIFMIPAFIATLHFASS